MPNPSKVSEPGSGSACTDTASSASPEFAKVEPVEVNRKVVLAERATNAPSNAVSFMAAKVEPVAVTSRDSGTSPPPTTSTRALANDQAQ